MKARLLVVHRSLDEQGAAGQGADGDGDEA